jgi:hypothetical protein
MCGLLLFAFRISSHPPIHLLATKQLTSPDTAQIQLFTNLGHDNVQPFGLLESAALPRSRIASESFPSSRSCPPCLPKQICALIAGTAETREKGRSLLHIVLLPFTSIAFLFCYSSRLHHFHESTRSLRSDICC